MNTLAFLIPRKNLCQLHRSEGGMMVTEPARYLGKSIVLDTLINLLIYFVTGKIELLTFKPATS